MYNKQQLELMLKGILVQQRNYTRYSAEWYKFEGGILLLETMLAAI